MRQQPWGPISGGPNMAINFLGPCAFFVLLGQMQVLIFSTMCILCLMLGNTTVKSVNPAIFLQQINHFCGIKTGSNALKSVCNTSNRNKIYLFGINNGLNLGSLLLAFCFSIWVYLWLGYMLKVIDGEKGLQQAFQIWENKQHLKKNAWLEHNAKLWKFEDFTF